MSQEITDGKLPKLFEAVSMKSLQLQQAIRAGDDQLVKLLDRELAPLISQVVDYRAANCREVHLQLRFISSLIREDADDRSCVMRNSTLLSLLLDRYFGGAAMPAVSDIDLRVLEADQGEDDAYLNESILNALPDRVAVVTPDYRYLYVNAAQAELLRRSPLELVGRHVGEFLPEGLFASLVRDKLDQCFAGRVLEFDYLRAGEQQTFFVHCHLSPLKRDDSRQVGAVLTMRDRMIVEETVAV